MRLQSNPGPLTFLSPAEKRYFAVHFLPSQVTVEGAHVVLTIADRTASIGPAFNSGNLKYDAMTQSWYVSSTGAFLRLWKNQHPYDLCRHLTDELTYAGKAGGPMEITCTCDADLCMVRS